MPSHATKTNHYRSRFMKKPPGCSTRVVPKQLHKSSVFLVVGVIKALEATKCNLLWQSISSTHFCSTSFWLINSMLICCWPQTRIRSCRCLPQISLLVSTEFCFSSTDSLNPAFCDVGIKGNTSPGEENSGFLLLCYTSASFQVFQHLQPRKD